MDAEPPPTTRRGARPGHRRTLLLFVLVAVVPVAGAAVRLHQARWIPEGDDAMIARRTMAVFSSHPPITGQPSTAGALFTNRGGKQVAADIEASHPGPMEYYLLAVPYRLSGWSPDGLLLAVALVNGAAASCAVWLAWRRLGSVGALGGALAVLFVAAHLGSWNLGRPLNAGIAVLPLLAGLVGLWGVLDRDRVAIVPTVLWLSLVIQCHLGAAPLAGVALTVAVVAQARTTWQTRPDRSSAQPAGETTRVRSIPQHELATPAPNPEPAGETTRVRSIRHRVPVWALGLVVLGLCWGPVLGQQLTGHPGNLSRLLDVARLRIDRAGLRFGVSVVFDQVVRPAWPGNPPLPRISIIGPIGLWGALAKGMALAAAFFAAGWWIRWSKRPDLVRMLAVALGAVIVPMVVLARGPDEVRLGPSYQVTSLTAVGGFVVLAFTVVIGEAVRRHVAHGPRHALAVRGGLASLALVAVTTAWFGGPTYREDALRTRAIADGIRAKVPEGTYKLQATGTWAYLSTLDAVSVELIRHGYDVRIVRLGGIPDEPHRRDTNVHAPTIMLDSTDRPRTDGRLLVQRPQLSADPTWASELLHAVSAADVTVRRTGPRVDLGACANTAPARAETADSPAHRRQVVLDVLACPQSERRAAMSRLRWSGLDPFWTDLLGSNMPAPYPHTGLAAYLLPAD